jgi:hypothetical protein
MARPLSVVVLIANLALPADLAGIADVTATDRSAFAVLTGPVLGARIRCLTGRETGAVGIVVLISIITDAERRSRSIVAMGIEPTVENRPTAGSAAGAVAVVVLEALVTDTGHHARVIVTVSIACTKKPCGGAIGQTDPIPIVVLQPLGTAGLTVRSLRPLFPGCVFRCVGRSLVAIDAPVNRVVRVGVAATVRLGVAVGAAGTGQ